MVSLYDYVTENVINIFEGATKDQIEAAKNKPGVHMIGGKCGWFDTADKFIKWLLSDDNKAQRTRKNMFDNKDKEFITNIITQCYADCIKEYGNELTYLTVPFVISTDKTNKFSVRTNVENDLSLISKYNLLDISRNFAETHTGFGSSAIKGLKFESQLVEALINVVINNIPEDNEISVGMKKTYECAKNFVEMTNLKEIYKNINPQDLHKYIVTSGQGKTARQEKNNDSKVLKNDFTFNSKALQSALIASGEIIADVTCIDPNGKNNIYISCKSGKAQLSGVANNNVFYKNGARNEANELFTNKKYLEDETNLKPLHGLCDLLGLNYDLVYEFYYKLNPNKQVTREKITYDNTYNENGGNEQILKQLILFIIGSNYYYINEENPSHICNVNLTNDIMDNIKLTLGASGISNSGRTIKRKATLNGQNVFFCFRQSKASHRYPYRLFLGDLDVPKFIESISK